jgi:hypothetical protein
MPSRTIDVKKIKPGTPNAQRVLAATPPMATLSASSAGLRDTGDASNVNYSRNLSITNAPAMNPNWNPAAQQAWKTANPQQPNQPPTNQPPSSPFPGAPSGQSNQINLPGTGTQSQFDTAFQAVMKDRMTKANAPYIGDPVKGGGIYGSVEAYANSTSELPSTEGWAGLTTSQAERVASLERNGLMDMVKGFSGALENRQTRQKDLLKTASDAYSDTLKAQADTHKEVAKRRQDATNQFLKLREDFAQKGIVLNEESGSKFLNLLQTSDNPEQVLNDYLVAASANPAVITAYRKPVKAPKVSSPSTPKTPKPSSSTTEADL